MPVTGDDSEAALRAKAEKRRQKLMSRMTSLKISDFPEGKTGVSTPSGGIRKAPDLGDSAPSVPVSCVDESKNGDNKNGGGEGFDQEKVLEEAFEKVSIGRDAESKVLGSEAAESEGPPLAKDRPANTSKMASYRKKRFKKKSAPASPELTSVPVENKDISVPSSPVTAADLPPKIDEPSSSVSPKGPKSPKKKYLGVAAMQRKRINQKKSFEEEPTASTTATTKKNAAAEVVSNPGNTIVGGKKGKIVQKKRSKRKRFMNLLPSLLELFTTVVLIICGFCVGVKSVHISSQSTPESIVHVGKMRTLNIADWGWQNFDGLIDMTPLGRVWGSGGGVDEDLGEENSSIAREALKKMIDNDYLTQSPLGAKYDEHEVVSKIDPVFRVDLHALTAGDGIYMSIARTAVSFHERLCSLASFPFRIFIGKSPPIMLVIAASIRFCRGLIFASEFATDELPSFLSQSGSNKFVDTVVRSLLSNFPTTSFLFKCFFTIMGDMWCVFYGFIIGVGLYRLEAVHGIYQTILKFDSTLEGMRSALMEGISGLRDNGIGNLGEL